MDELEFTLQLVDKMTAPLMSAAKALQTVQDQLKKTNSQAAKGGSSTGGFGGLVTSLNQAFEVARKVTGALVAVGEVGLAAATFAVQTGSYKSSLQQQMQMMLKLSSDEAKMVVGEINKIAASTPFESKDVADAVKKFIGAGFTKSEAFEMLNTVGDIAAFNDFDTEIIKRMTMVISQVKGKGRLMGDDMLQMIEATGGAISPAKLAQVLGMDPQTFQKAMEGGKLTAEKVLPAIQKLIKDGISGGESGGLMKKMSQEIPGLLSTLKDVPFLLIPSIDDSKGLSAFREFLRKIASLFDGEGEMIKRFSDAVGRIIDSVFGGFAELSDEDIKEFFARVAGAVEDIADALENVDSGGILDKLVDGAGALATAVGALSSGTLSGIADLLGPIGEGMSAFGSNKEAWRVIGKLIGWTIGLLILIGGWMVYTATILYQVGAAVSDLAAELLGFQSAGAMFGAMWESIAEFWSGIYDAALDIAGDFIDGLVQGIKDGAAYVVDAVAGLGGEMLDTATGVLDINSPSKEGEWIGENLGLGIAGGVDKQFDNVQGAMASLASPDGMAASAGSSSASSKAAGNTFNFEIHIAGANVDAATIESLKGGITQAASEAFGVS